MNSITERNSQLTSCEPGCTKCELCSKIGQLTRSSLMQQINLRIQDFKKMRKSSKENLFSELCFCILTANFSAARGIQIQNQLGSDILTMSERDLATRLKNLGYRFPNTRANYIFESRKWYETLDSILVSYQEKNQRKLRNWLAKNVKGLGLKEGSHFLRNIGYHNCAIVDFHIIDILCDYQIIEKPKSLTVRKYEEIESILERIADINHLTLAELDLILWFMETGQILK